MTLVEPAKLIFGQVFKLSCFRCIAKCCNKDITQKQANILSEGPKIEAAVNIATYMNILCTCVFFSPLIPHTIPFACFGSMWTYWIWKYNFLRNNNRPEMFSQFMATFFANGMPYIGLLWAISFLFFTEQIITQIIEEDGIILKTPSEEIEDLKNSAKSTFSNYMRNN